MAGKSLGTAWIQIKPTTKNITSEMRKELAAVEQEMQRTASNYQGAFIRASNAIGRGLNGLGNNFMNSFSKATSSICNETQALFTGTFEKIGQASKMILATSLTATVGLLTSTIGSAVSRIDTLKNAPRVFDAMGYSVDEVNNTMSRLDEYLSGLPTTLDDAVGGVQLLAASFGGLENGTKYFEAMNDAGLAFGANTEQIQNAIIQLSQLSMDGPLDAQTWMSLQNSGFGPVFSAMAKEAGITTGELKEQFGEKGTRTVQDFLDALVRMDKEGSGSMASLAELAKANTDGIATSFKNAKTAITRGVAESIEAIPNLTSSVVLAGKSIENVLKGKMGMDEAAKNINDFVGNMSQGIMNLATKIVPLVLTVLPGTIKQIATSIAEYFKNEENVTTLVNGVVELVKSVASAANEIAQAILPYIPNIITTIAQGIVSIMPQLTTTLMEVIDSLTETLCSLLEDDETSSTMIDSFIELFVKVAESASKIAEKIVPLVPEIIGKLVSELFKPEHADDLAAGLGILFSAAVAKTLASNALSSITELPGKLVGKVTSKVDGAMLKKRQNQVEPEIILPNQKDSTGITGASSASTLIDTSSGDQTVTEVTSWGQKIADAIKNIAEPIKQAFGSLGEILGSVVGAVMEPIKAVFTGVGEALAGFFTALASPTVAVGAAMFAAVAASIAAAILLIGSAIGVVMPTLQTLFETIIMPIAVFIRDTVLILIQSLTDALTVLTQNVLLPIGNFLTGSLIAIIQTVAGALINLTQSAVIPLVNTLSGAFCDVLRTVSDALNGILSNALNGIKDIVVAVGDGFTKMGEAVRNALEGVQGVIQAFADLINGMAAAIVAVVSLATGRSIDYGYGYAHLGYAEGGRVFGAGTATSDSIPAMLSRDEYVIRAASARKIGYDNLDALNEGRLMETGTQQNYFTINGYNKSPEELANIISRKIAFKQRGVIG